MHLIGVQGMPRRVADYAEQFAGWNLFDLDRLVRPRPQHADLRSTTWSRRGAAGRARVGQPVARAHARVAGLLAAADLQLRPGPDGRRRPVRVRRPRRRPRHLQTRPPRRARADAGGHARRRPRREGGSSTREDDPRRRQRDPRRARSCSTRSARRRPPRATRASSSCVPRNRPHARQRHLRRRRLRRRAGADRPRAQRFLRERGHRGRRRGRRPRPVHGGDGRDRRAPPRRGHRLDAARATTSGWLRRDLVERIEDASGAPGRARRHRPRRARASRSTSRSSSPTAPPSSDELLERAQGRSRAEGERTLFIVVVPQEGGAGHAAARGARRAWRSSSTALRAADLLAAGMIGDPDPYTATMNALQLLPRRRHRHLHAAPTTRSGWLRADLIERVRKATDKPVEHVESPPRTPRVAA